ncbi:MULTISPECIES: bifunctional biotin--[acetyl-CoA-carboxylase] ligase/biotin operon repressor BirA [Vibrio]|jgi:BirA family biotin operon repressor/biotin-[acetyl-CoA-carboxylase] ligase|uniref:Bifunctional ligase/repressor BirA n=1 Tax=Vibrio natriegens NBRC 15636 = ATCC 14048 = DSM 759 TaxID=1219067 RepID=A0AAN1CWP0_VIBNA|nr:MULTISPECIES: bifunctional biotin--[acetyl-CoA-carboxylase] ligase/biotin operon repressor BirA [Vibrio]ALR14478.1 biotin--[acetyl-CoA-carboxylase] synthetase [Vibrio natriegens NBRC 15636 = ATCC 14048 = DSM 759]ANQ13804.1 biotin--[acetyl-CoA-carboxylase] ligase [Vibrio natriegens NBRC 15636 = ATCC 14048 = DSM 759]AXT72143.1 bifunctional biotin--[acetyl-CoA-carboxylase] ligase/biotin operon repressor BirA [Vibrio sp. dhg]EPM41259.1 bifunctional biotin--[acetyl-CoA-carboxylase] synthetase/bio
MRKEHATKLHILKTLSDGEFHSGEALGHDLGISRAAIAKHIKGLSEWGVDIYRIQGRGYQLAHPMQLLDETRLTDSSEPKLELIPVIDSTNQYLLERVNESEKGRVCVAEYQASGRGRRGRQWVSPFGSNLYLSMYWRLDAGMAAAMGLSLVIGIAAVEALEEMGIQGVKLKWPNDLYYQDKKLAGILVEMSGQAGGAANLVIGMGLNIGMPDKQPDIDQPWTTLNQVCADLRLDRTQLALTLIEHWKTILVDYEMMGLAGFVDRWNRLDNFIGRPVKLLMGAREVKGIVQGIDQQGGVVLETDNGLETYIGGEISLRKGD